MSRRGAAGLVLALAASVLAGCATPTGGRGEPSATAPASSRTAVAATPGPAPSTTTTAPRPRPNPCAGNTAAQFVLVSVTRQHVWLCERARTVYDAPVTTGAVDLPYDSTPTGTFVVQAKQTDRTLTLLSGVQYQVKYWIPFDAPLFGFHDASWQDIPFGSQRYRTEGSHGCVHLPLPAMAYLYKWVDLDTTVTIRA